METHYGNSHPIDVSPGDFLSLLVDAESSYLENTKMKRLVDHRSIRIRKELLGPNVGKSLRSLRLLGQPPANAETDLPAARSLSKRDLPWLDLRS
jgi:hypothetical protein